MRLLCQAASVLAATLLVVACNSSDFSGNSKKAASRAEDAKEEPKDEPSEEPKDEPTDEPTDTGEPGDVGDSDDNNIFDTLNGLLGTDSDTAASTQVNDNEIVFGTNKVFRIGNNKAAGSSCQIELLTFTLAGTKYYFEFEVTQPDTQINMTIEKVCGIDYPDTNYVSIQQGTTAIVQPQLITAGASNVAVPTATLGVGKYVVLVESRTGTTSGIGDPDDNDDFIVGNIRIKGTKAIKPGKVGAQ
jgi:hypothetical protein